ncbi:MAG: hypothetical protein CM15mP51_18490 [Porticoccaceae bacterium]|nr:MAG: hypothetical protein CM15mP51_18490 [Porticoccaceae bacterium]
MHIKGLVNVISGLFILLALTSCGVQNTESTTKVDDRLNVIYILTDDQRYDELGFMNPVIDTPHMDRLASEGVHFENAFVTTALCSPSRATILTGQYMHEHGVVDNNSPPKEGTIFSRNICRNLAIRQPLLENGTWERLHLRVESWMILNLDLITG